jgi:uncharacterized protein (TIGR00106 family)
VIRRSPRKPRNFGAVGFNHKGEEIMLAELSIVPLGGNTHLSAEIAAVLELVDDSGLRYQLTPCGTCIEGEWDEVMDLVRRCHERARERSPHVFTTIRIEDEQDARDKLVENVASVERKLGRTLGSAGPE